VHPLLEHCLKEDFAGHDSYAADIDSIQVIVAAPPFLSPSSLPHVNIKLCRAQASTFLHPARRKLVTRVCSYPVSMSSQQTSWNFESLITLQILQFPII
jgi:hypothetical protein